MKIGEIMPLDREITLNEGKETRTLLVPTRETGRCRWAPITIFLR